MTLILNRAGKILALPLMFVLAGCVKPPMPQDYTAFHQSDPRAILVVPVVNDTAQVDAATNFLATLSQPLGERGYYVFPVNLVAHQMDDNGLGDADMVSKASPVRLAGLFGADSVLYARIERWDAQYVVVSTNVTVQVHYSLKDGKTGATLWDQDVTTVYSPQANGGNPLAVLIADAIMAAIERAHPNYIPLAQQANAIAFTTPNQGVPYGPYDDKHGGF
jgi:hypothetical protein